MKVILEGTDEDDDDDDDGVSTVALCPYISRFVCFFDLFPWP